MTSQAECFDFGTIAGQYAGEEPTNEIMSELEGDAVWQKIREMVSIYWYISNNDEVKTRYFAARIVAQVLDMSTSSVNVFLDDELHKLEDSRTEKESKEGLNPEAVANAKSEVPRVHLDKDQVNEKLTAIRLAILDCISEINAKRKLEADKQGYEPILLVGAIIVGSWARGDPTKDSDLDIIWVTDDDPGRSLDTEQTEAILTRALSKQGLDMSVEVIHFWSKTDVQKGEQHIFAEMLHDQEYKNKVTLVTKDDELAGLFWSLVSS
jgi:predicted nucleotidyltransferase